MSSSDYSPINDAGCLVNFPLSILCSFSSLRRHYDIPWPPNDNGARGAGVLLDLKFASVVLKMLADRVPVDDTWYRGKYPDVEDGIYKGEFKSAKHHYVEFGYFEDRFPRHFEVDAEFYRSTYPDIVEYIETGRLASSQEHFEIYGFKEGRLPWSDWRLVG